MANTVTQRTLTGGGSDRKIVRMVHIVSDGSEETDLVVFDNSAFIADVSKGKLAYIYVIGDAGTIRLEWDQTADSPALSLDPQNGMFYDFRNFGGIGNPGAAGATGDLVLTSADLDPGDELTIIFCIEQN